MEPLQVLKVFPLGLLLCWAFNGAACAISAQAQGSPPASNMLLIGDGVIVHWNAREIALQKADGARIDVAELFGDATYKVVRAQPVGAYVVRFRSVEVANGTASEFVVVKLSVSGAVLQRWMMPDSVLDIEASSDAIVLTSTQVVRLDDSGKQTVLAARGNRESKLLSLNGMPILCRPTDTRMRAPNDPETGAACRSLSGWRFDGSWTRAEPLVCGRWIVEPVEQRRASRVRTWRVRNGQGIVETTLDYTARAFTCLGDAGVLDVEAQRVLPLPTGTPAHTVLCGSNRITGAVAGDPAGGSCVDELGRLQRVQHAPSTSDRPPASVRGQTR